MTYASAHGSLSAAALTAPTLGEALRILERYAYLRGPYFRLVADRDAHTLTLRVVEHVALGVGYRRSLLAALVLSLQALVESSLGRAMAGGGFELPGPPPSPHATQYDQSFDAPVHFRGESAAISVPLQWLALPCPLADPVRHASALTDLEALERRFYGNDHVVDRVRRLIAEGGPRPPTLREAAKRLRLSQRTLIRRLQEHDVSFRGLLVEFRRRSAERLLTDPTLTVAEVGFRLGYANSANFGRAFRRWFQASPVEYRQRAVVEGAYEQRAPLDRGVRG